MKLQLSVKELSEIVGISTRNIRYYDQIGLFKPSGQLENGYRYYTIEKIEELRLISYLRHLDISIQEIKAHLENRSLENYLNILANQLDQTRIKMKHLEFLEKRLEKRMQSLAYIHQLEDIDKITIKPLSRRPILRLNEDIREPLDWEIAMLKFEKDDAMPPSLFIGDIGFFVDLSTLDRRHPTEFTGLYLDLSEGHDSNSSLISELPEGLWLTLYFKGDHFDAPQNYKKLMQFANHHHLKLDHYALERVLIDHFISSDPNLYITEIQIKIIT
ncbi:MerR family transcriptional regulator [Fusibacter ferrireducens]|uniref:MerR family transcriptional regulator n=1 Tax=Fusibacter ferrireducens TaxID=2785058 RepID=A0ABR9ZSS2_9FIRM|nr:MerR family transcriptional regulator [Fusibacter ferrireducens]MBF4692659.1 MerR family transcriptional regulator [Fusibacter ferrireducens]